jgi:hypothetical protein
MVVVPRSLRSGLLRWLSLLPDSLMLTSFHFLILLITTFDHPCLHRSPLALWSSGLLLYAFRAVCCTDLYERL